MGRCCRNFAHYPHYQEGKVMSKVVENDNFVIENMIYEARGL